MRACSFDDCTFEITGRCIQGSPVAECAYVLRDVLEEGDIHEEEKPHSWREVSDETQATTWEATAGQAVLFRLEGMPRLPSSMTLGTEEARDLMSSEYTTMVGIVGLPDSGKTACLVSAYLLLSKGQFKGYSYANSRSLMAFEQITRGSRQWTSGEPPSQLTLRTELVDDRQAGFLHLKLRRNVDGRLFNLLLPDLPGEWSNTLIDKADSERFNFIRSATVIWLMVDGREFADLETRNYAIHRTELLIGRLADIVTTPAPRVILVPSWRDRGVFPAEAFEQIKNAGLVAGINITFAPIASFSDNAAVAPGEGVGDLFDITLNHDRVCPEFWPDDSESKVRKLCSFRSV